MDKLLYMIDDTQEIQLTIESRKNLYPIDLKKKWSNIKPTYKKTNDGEIILQMMGHEVMSKFEAPYMKKLAEIVTRPGGDILNIGYGLGLLDIEIEKYRKTRHINNHFVIELNKHIATRARKIKNLIVIQKDWSRALEDDFRGMQFNGIVYDGYPLKFDELHRDGIIFIEKIARGKFLKKDGVLTFYADAISSFGKKFISFLKGLGFKFIQTEKVFVTYPNRKVQYWRQSYFLAPILRYN